MKILSILLFAALNLAIYGQETNQEIISNKLTTEHISVAGTKVSLIPPVGFQKSVNFFGFQQNDNNSSIMVLEMPGSFSEISKAFTKSGFQTKGIELIDKKDITINDFSAVFIEAEQSAYGITFIKYILTFGTENSTIMINGMLPKSLREEMGSEIRKSLLSVVYESNKEVDPLDKINFTVDIENTKLKYTKVLANAVLYTVDGKIPTESEDRTFYSIGRSIGIIDITDKKKSAIERLNKTAMMTNIKPEKITEIEIYGFSGYEIIAEATYEKTGKAVKIYFVMLFDDNFYYLIIGIAEDDFESNIELFKEVSKSFRLK